MIRRLAVLALLVLVGCGESDVPSGGPAPAVEGGAEEGAFPVTIEHKYGSTTIEEEPKRVFVAGLREQDPLLALGIVPVGTTQWIPGSKGGVYPWAEDELGDAKTPVQVDSTDGIQVEKIASLQPDVIIAVYSGLTKKDYDTLSKLAPVVAQPKGKPDFGTSWQEETLTTGEAVGRPQAAQDLVGETEKLIADTAAEHPEFKGKQAAMAMDYKGAFVYGPDDVRSRTLVELGFEYPPGLENAFPNEFGGQLSDEKLDELDVDALVWFAGADGGEMRIKGNPVYSKLPVHEEGRDVFMDDKDRAFAATPFATVLSIPTVMKELVPRLAAAVDGDPNTSTEERPAG